MYPIHFFLENLSIFPGDFINVPSKVPKCSPIQSCSFGKRNVPTLKTLLRLLKIRRFGGVDPPKGLENTPEAQNFLEISDLTAMGTGLAWQSQQRSKFSADSKERVSEPGVLRAV
jgi:hypothetical protein